MRNLLWPGLVMLLLLSGCGWSGDATRQNDITPLTSITITAKYTTIAQGTSVKLTAIGNFSGYFNHDISDQVTWSSATPAVADFVTTVHGRVKGLTQGSTVVTATLKGVSATFNLTVSPATATAVTVTPANQTVPAGTPEQFTATGAFSDGSTQDITFDVAWASSNTAVATISNAADDNNGGLAQTHTVNANTTITITATFTFGGVGMPGSTSLTVTAPVLQSIAVSIPTTNPTPITTVLSLSRVTFAAKGTYSDTSTKDITSQVTWASSNTGVVPPPDSTGATQTVTQGTSTITATLNGINGTLNLTVNGGNLASFTLPTSMTAVNGTSAPISVTGTFSNGITRDITGGLIWSVANTTPIRATLTGPTGNRLLVNAVATGTTAITATAPGSSGLAATTNLTVRAPGLVSFAVSPLTGLALTAGTSGRLTATATFSDNTTQDVTADVTWGSNSTAIATVGAVGPTGVRITGVATGTTSIKASFGGQDLTTPIQVAVSTRNLQRITIAPSGTQTLTAGNQTNFTATASYSDGTTVDVTNDVTWATGDGNIAVLPDSQNQPGVVVGVSSGSTPLTATFGGLNPATVTLKVQ